MTSFTMEIPNKRESQRTKITAKSECRHYRMRRNPDRREQELLSISISVTPPLPQKTEISDVRNTTTKKNNQQIPLQEAPQKDEIHLCKRYGDRSRNEGPWI